MYFGWINHAQANPVNRPKEGRSRQQASRICVCVCVCVCACVRACVRAYARARARAYNSCSSSCSYLFQ